MNRTLLASRRHTATMLAILATVTVLGMQSAAAGTAAGGSVQSRVLPYLVLIAMECLWVRYVYVGLRAQGHTLSALIGDEWARRTVGADAVYGALGFVAARILADSAKRAIGGGGANTAFLLPHGLAESILWVLVSSAAGIGEEVVFRGYFQQQFGRLTGNALAGVLLQAILFGVAHGYQGLASIAVTGSYGLTFGILAWWRGNVRAGVLAHVATDLVGGLVRF
jgi:membrane protease YdiL (CAAX protease family)